MSPPDNLKPPAGKNNDFIALLDRLSEHDPALHEEAARAIFALGLARAKLCAGNWFRDQDVAGYFIFHEPESHDRFPRTTVGIAVEPSRFAQIHAANGLPRLADVPPDLGAEEFEIHADESVRLDILTTREPAAEGAIARFLRKHGEGIQQVELTVRSVERATDLLRGRFGLVPAYAQARDGADGTRVNFFLMPLAESGNLLIELVEEPAART